MACANRRPGHGQYGIDTNAAQVGALAGHIAAGDQYKFSLFGNVHGVGHTPFGCNQGMTHFLSFNEKSSFGEHGEYPLRMIELQGGQGTERFQCSECIEPAEYFRMVCAFPAFQGEGLLEVPLKENSQRNKDNDVQPEIEPFQYPVQGT